MSRTRYIIERKDTRPEVHHKFRWFYKNGWTVVKKRATKFSLYKAIKVLTLLKEGYPSNLMFKTEEVNE